MSKCGKGCMPECEYFVTCGCISPFNCPYKIDENYQNSAFTTGNSNFLSGIEKWFMQLVEEGKLPQTPMNYDMASYKAYVAHLEAENAALKERLGKVVEPPCKIGDILYTVTIVFSDGWVGDTILRRNSFCISETEVTEKNIWSICDLIRRGMAFFSKEAAEARLKELKGGEE